MANFELHYYKFPKLRNSFINNSNYCSKDNDIEYNLFNIDKFQPYNPIYNNLFYLDETNFNRISLNHKYHFVDNLHVIDNTTQDILDKSMFFKFSPLVDPVRYLLGKYNSDNLSCQKLPDLKSNTDNTIQKMLDTNNVSYIDNFFNYLTSQLLHNHHFIHSTDYYGSFLGIQEKFKVDITEDIEYLLKSKYFNNNSNKLCEISHQINEFTGCSSRANKDRLNFKNNTKHNLTLASLPALDISDVLSIPDNDIIDISNNLIFFSNNIKQDSSDEDSSDEDSSDEDSSDEVSNLDDSNDEDEDNSIEDIEYSSNNGSISSSKLEDTEIFAYIKNFPVHAICLEKCDGTFDQLFESEMLSSHEGICALFQIIMILICYQKCFNFTHNDLHTNNIMYSNTDKEFIYYHYNKQLYKVPTYGKIYKIIDFGRAVYKFKGTLYMSDSFSPHGDAHTQFNCEPYYNPDKPRLEPNYSFDLCRLGCSIYDFIIDEDEDEEDFNDLQKVINLWCKDNYGKNILYKKNGEERYPNFKLYKMITRTVHQHTPEKQLKLPYFKQFECSKSLAQENTIIDIDIIPSYAN